MFHRLDIERDLAGACAASVWEEGLLLRTDLADLGNGWMTPISLFTARSTRPLSCGDRRAQGIEVDDAVLLHRQIVTSKPFCSRWRQLSSTHCVLGHRRDDVVLAVL